MFHLRVITWSTWLVWVSTFQRSHVPTIWTRIRSTHKILLSRVLLLWNLLVNKAFTKRHFVFVFVLFFLLSRMNLLCCGFLYVHYNKNHAENLQWNQKLNVTHCCDFETNLGDKIYFMWAKTLTVSHSQSCLLSVCAWLVCFRSCLVNIIMRSHEKKLEEGAREGR